jgi:hypothetical protein
VIIGTPSLILKLLQKDAIPAIKDNAFSIVMDKLELMQALDFGDDLTEISKAVNKANSSLPIVITTTAGDQ